MLRTQPGDGVKQSGRWAPSRGLRLTQSRIKDPYDEPYIELRDQIKDFNNSIVKGWLER
jgi:hypothetical protein